MGVMIFVDSFSLHSIDNNVFERTMRVNWMEDHCVISLSLNVNETCSNKSRWCLNFLQIADFVVNPLTPIKLIPTTTKNHWGFFRFECFLFFGYTYSGLQYSFTPFFKWLLHKSHGLQKKIFPLSIYLCPCWCKKVKYQGHLPLLLPPEKK